MSHERRRTSGESSGGAKEDRSRLRRLRFFGGSRGANIARGTTGTPSRDILISASANPSPMKRSQSAASALHVGGGTKAAATARARAAANAAAIAPAQPAMDPLYPPGMDSTFLSHFRSRLASHHTDSFHSFHWPRSFTHSGLRALSARSQSASTNCRSRCACSSRRCSCRPTSGRAPRALRRRRRRPRARRTISPPRFACSARPSCRTCTPTWASCATGDRARWRCDS